MFSQVLKCIQDRRRQRRHRLPASSLRQIPTSKFAKGHPYETCAICLEDYVEGEKLRLLPCSHGLFNLPDLVIKSSHPPHVTCIYGLLIFLDSLSQ